MRPSIRSAVLVTAMIPIVNAGPRAGEPQPLIRHQPTFEQFTTPAYPVELAAARKARPKNCFRSSMPN